jgi:hypothetical protein
MSHDAGVAHTEVVVSSQDTDRPAPIIDTSVAHPARRYNYFLGGKDNFQADRDSGDAIARMFPTIRIAALENRSFLRRAVEFLVRDAGIKQFLDIGTGIPTADNTHEVAQSMAPDARVVYVDNDPIVLVHARALLTSTPEGRTAYIDADLRNPEQILADPELRNTLDLNQPIALMMIAVLHFIMDDRDNPYGVVHTLVDALPSGSYVAITNVTTDFMPEHIKAAALQAQASRQQGDIQFRSRDDFARFFDGLELVEPGIVSVHEWRARDEPEPRRSAADVSVYGAIGRKP